MSPPSRSKGRTIAIGDIHGCATALRTLVERLAPKLDDTLIPLGDYIDRGPDSRQVVDQLVALVDRCTIIPLIGNHEILLLEAMQDREMFDFWQHCGGDATLASYGGSLDGIPPDHMTFLRGLRVFYETATHLFVHANYEHDRPLEETPESTLFWDHVSLKMPKPHFSGKTVVVGHTPQPSGAILDCGYLLCIDTYCFGGGWLTALDITDGHILQANEQGQFREFKLADRLS